MKKLIASALLLTSIGAHAMMVEEFYDEETGDISALIRNPEHKGSKLPLSAYLNPSNENGVCKRLGYEKAASGSIRAANTKKLSLTINSNGLVTGALQDFPVSQIVCLNQTNTYPDEKSVIVTNPTHSDSGMPLSSYLAPSSGQGVCLLKGYNKFVSGSMQSSGSKADTLRIDEAGNVSSGPVDYPISQIICLTK